MKFKKCKKLLKKLSDGLNFTDKSKSTSRLSNNKKFIGKQVYSNKTGNYGYITHVKTVDESTMYIIDWTSYGTVGGFPKLVQEQHETLDDIIVLDR